MTDDISNHLTAYAAIDAISTDNDGNTEHSYMSKADHRSLYLQTSRNQRMCMRD
jgi:hypothetical protein